MQLNKVLQYKQLMNEVMSTYQIEADANTIKNTTQQLLATSPNDYKEIIANHIVNPQDDKEKQVNRELLNEAISYATYIYEQNNEDEIYTARTEIPVKICR